MRKNKYLTNEQMSRILSEHAVGQLSRRGARLGLGCWLLGMEKPLVGNYCALQAAYNDYDLELYTKNSLRDKFIIFMFDGDYQEDMSSKQLINLLDKAAEQSGR